MKKQTRSITGILAALALAGGCGVGTDLIGSQSSAVEGVSPASQRMAPANALVRTPATSLNLNATAPSTALPATARDFGAIQPAVPTGNLPRVVPSPDQTPCWSDGQPTAFVQSASLSGVAVPSKVSWRFQVAKVKTIYLAALVRNLCGAHVASFDLFAPDGSYHGRLLAPFVAEGDGEGARQVDAGYVVEVALPVADLAAGSLIGLWSVNVSVDADNLGDAIGVGLFELLE